MVQAFDQSGRFDDPISLVENGPPKLWSGPLVCLWLALSYALAGRKERAATDFATFRVLAPKWTAVDHATKLVPLLHAAIC